MGGRRKSLFRNWFVCCSVLCFLAMAMGGAGSAFAEDDEFILEEIVVTGSRIVRNNNESSSPIVTVDEKLFQNQASVAIETALNRLPQFTPTLDTPTAGGGDIQPNARNTPGEATIALRGIGSNRTLTLINGRRGTPSNALNVVDINTIPSAAIEYTEIISGGASSVYGADAMAGVLNFIMREHFEGAQIDAQASINEEGDNLEYQYSGIVGANIADDRGNVSMAFSYTERQDAKRKDRKWYRDEWKRTTVAGDQYFTPFTGINFNDTDPWGTAINYPSVDVANEVVGHGANYPSTYNFGFYYDPESGQIFSGFTDGDSEEGIPAAIAAGIVDGYQTKLGANGILSTNNIENYLIFPMERYNVFTRGNYDINDRVGIYGQAYFNKVSTVTIQEPAPLFNFWDVEIDPQINRDVIPAGMMALIDSRDDPNAPVTISALLPYNRGSETDVYTYNIVVGLHGTVPKIDWTWDFNVQHGEAQTTVLNTGFASLQRLRAIMQEPNFGEGFEQSSNQEHDGFAAATGTCESGLNPFSWNETVTADCYDAIRADLKTKMFTNQDIYELNLEGPIVELPAGELRGAVGYVYRENEYTYLNDTIVMQGTSFLEQGLGLYPSKNTYGTLDVGEGYVEFLVPLLKDLPFVQNLSLELGGRRSDYNTTGVSYTYKALADWRILDWLRIRGGYNRAERAPNIAELYLGSEQTFAFDFSGGDVCGFAHPGNHSVSKENNPDHWQEVVELCGKLMEASGDPTADDTFYGSDYREIMAGADPGFLASITGAWYSGFPTTIGNPDLEPETADTWTAGIVIDSPFRNIPYLADMRLSVDYYSIKVTDAIGEQSPSVVMQQCVDPRFNPTYDPDSPYCALFPRTTDGQIGNLQRTFYNNGRFRTSGLDFQLTWGMDLGPGRLGVTSTANYLIEMKSSELTINPMVEYAGSQGPSGNGLNGNSYRFRMLNDFSYQIDDLRIAVQWTHLGPIQPGPNYNPDSPGIREYDVFNLSGNYNLTDNLWIRFGVNNVLNDKPPYMGRNFADTNEGMIGGQFPFGNYDTVGRSYWLGARINF